jgi:hypothetical protein
MCELVVTNERICKFYENNPAINFEAVNLIFIDLFDKILSDVNSTMNATINAQILSDVNKNTQMIRELNSSITFLKDSMGLKFTDIKKEYVDELKLILQNNTAEKIAPLLEKNNNTLIDKTTLVVNDIIPKSQTQYYSQIQESIRSFHKSISDDTRVLLKYVDNNSIKDYIQNFEMKSSMMLQNMQQPIYTFITASEERIQSGFKENTVLQNKLIGELTEIISSYKNNVSSREQSKNTPINILLNKLYNTSEVSPLHKNYSNNPMFSRTTEIKSSSNGFLMKRTNKQRILIQNIDVDRNVSPDEIKEFVQNIEENNCHGIFLSQSSGFTSKPNYHIETHNKLIMIYLHNVEYSMDKIKSAVDMIDNLACKLKEFNNNEFDISIEKDVLEEINREYQSFIMQKENIINVLKESQKKVFSQIDDFKFTALDKYLSTKFAAPVNKQGFKCDLCKNFNAHNLKALAAHKRGCNRKNAVIVTPQNTAISI